MTRHILLFLSFLLVFEESNAQYSKLIVQFTGKSGTTYSLSNPQAYLSEKAVERRRRFKIPIDSTDLPVSNAYIDSVKGSGAVVVLSRSKWLNQILIETTDERALEKIRSMPFVRLVKKIGRRSNAQSNAIRFSEYPDQAEVPDPVHRKATQNELDYGSSYDQVHIHNGEFLHNKGFKGETIRIALLDAGFYNYTSLNAFDSIRINKQVMGERDFVAFDNSVAEDDAHGMFCLSTLCANWPGKMVGTAPKAGYWLIRTEDVSKEYPVEEHNWVVGAEFADSAGCDMISSSLGYFHFDDAAFNYSYSNFYNNTTISAAGASAAARKGMIVTNSAGNEGSTSWKFLTFPADVDSVCSVAAVNTTGQIASFSSYGYPGRVKPNIASVGEHTIVAGLNNSVAAYSGTSFANPNVAGLIACLWQAFPKKNNMAILRAVYASSNRYNHPDNRYGYGIPDFRSAYRLLKHEENLEKYGNDWLFVSPALFFDTLQVTLIGRIDGHARLELLGPDGSIVKRQDITTESEEVYTFTLPGLAALPAGNYTLRYADSSGGAAAKPVKKSPSLIHQWITVYPNPFKTSFTIYVNAPFTGKMLFSLHDAAGRLVYTTAGYVTENAGQSFELTMPASLAYGVYYLHAEGGQLKEVITLLKE